MKPFNWTDCAHPCFQDYYGDPMSMTKEEFIEEAENVVDCDAFLTVHDETGCRWLQKGHAWEDCREGGLSPHCPDSIKVIALKEEEK